MKIIISVCLGLLFCIEPANAQKEYSLRVSIHATVRPPLTSIEIATILDRASKLLVEGNNCGVKFKLDSVGTFASAPSIINNASDLEAVHSVDAEVKVVRQINFCRGQQGSFLGCSWRPGGLPKTMIVIRQVARDLQHILWAHEFGHTKGLQHRADPEALMTPCPLYFDNLKVNQDECYCMLNPGACSIVASPVCTELRSRRLRWNAD
jgi:hypothetical protein